MMRWSVATVADILGREVIVPACLDRSFVPATDGKAALLKVQGVPMPSEPIKHYLSYHKADQHQRLHNQPGKLLCRCFVGKLTDEQVVEFKKISDIDNITDFYLQGVDTLSISSPKDKPVHQAAIRNFNKGLFDLAHCSEKYCKLTGDYTGVTKSLLEHCENCECMSICEHKSPDCGLYSNCIHPVFRSLFPAAHNFAFNSSVLDVPAFQKLDIQERIRFNRSVHRIRHIVVICELKLHVEKILAQSDVNVSFTNSVEDNLIDLRNKMCNDLRCETDKTWRQIAEEVNAEFPNDGVDEKSAEIVAREYRKKHKLPTPPSRKRGRKSKNRQS